MMSLVFKFICSLFILCLGDIAIVCILDNLGLLSILSMVALISVSFCGVGYLICISVLKYSILWLSPEMNLYSTT